MKSLVRLGIPFLGTALFACVPEEGAEPIPISANEAALTATENVEASLNGVVDAADFLADSSSIVATLNAMSGSEEVCESSGVSCAPGESCPPPEVECYSDEVTEADLQELRDDLRELAQEIGDELREHVFTEENLESETETTATYRLGPDILCGDSDDDFDSAPRPAPDYGGEPTPYPPEGEGDAIAPPPDDSDPPPASDPAPPDATSDDSEHDYDPDCVADLERQQPRVRLSSTSAGDIDVTLLIGEARHEVVSLQLYQSSLGVTVDAGAFFLAANDIGEPIEGIDSMRGVVQARLVRNDSLDYSLQYNVLEEISVSGTTGDDEAIQYSMAPSSPAYEIRVDGVQETLTASMDLGRVLLQGPFSAFASDFGGDDDTAYSDAPVPYPGPDGEPPPPPPEPEPEPEYHGALELLLAGLSGTITYTGDDDRIQLSNLGLGDGTSHLTHDGNTLLGVDLNAAAGRRFNLLVEALEEDGARLTFDPSFEMQVQFGFQHIQDQIADIGGFLLDDTLTVALSGDNPVVEVGEQGIEVISGELSLSSSTMPESNITVDAGMCLMGMEDDAPTADGTADESSNAPEGGHELLSELSAGMCQ